MYVIDSNDRTGHGSPCAASNEIKRVLRLRGLSPTMLKHLTRALVFAPFAGVRSKFVVLGRRDNTPPGFSLIGSPPADEVLTLRLALAQSNIQGLQDAVYDISTPGGPRYGQYLTQAEVINYVLIRRVERLTEHFRLTNTLFRRPRP
jgi:hypothetical protein